MDSDDDEEQDDEGTVEVGDERIQQVFDFKLVCCTSAFGMSGADESGGVIWGAGFVLARFVQAELVAGRLDRKQKWLELGCGLALPSLVATKYGVDITATDNSKTVLRRLKHNADRNNLKLQIAQLDWDTHSIDETFDIVLASDLVYSEEQALTLAPLVHAITKGIFIFAARDGRRGESIFLNQLKSLGFRVVHNYNSLLNEEELQDAFGASIDDVQRQRLTEAPHTIRVFRRLDHILANLATKRKELADCKHQMTQLQHDLRNLSTTFQQDIHAIIGTLQKRQQQDTSSSSR